MDLEALRDSLIRREGGPAPPPLWSAPPERAEEMARAADAVEDSLRAAETDGGNLVARVLRGQGAFAEWRHYPKGDAYDRRTGAQYYYHAHPSALRGGEHGHFHTFLRAAGMPKRAAPAKLPAAVKRPLGKDALSHLVGISMDRRGRPLRLFTTNRWVTGESWYAAGDVIAMLDCFEIGGDSPDRAANRWLGAMIRLFRPQAEWLLRERDEALRVWRAGHPDAETPAWEDRALEVMSVIDVSIAAQAELARAAAASRRFGA